RRAAARAHWDPAGLPDNTSPGIHESAIVSPEVLASSDDEDRVASAPMLNLRVARPRAVIDISRIPVLKTISVQPNAVVTGAGVTQSDALGSDLIQRGVPLLAMALPWVGHFQTRNRGTLGGRSLTQIRAPKYRSLSRGQRRVPAREFFVGVLMT